MNIAHCLDALLEKSSDDICITPEWICDIHRSIAEVPLTEVRMSKQVRNAAELLPKPIKPLKLKRLPLSDVVAVIRRARDFGQSIAFH